MTLDHKKKHIIRCIKLGIDLYKACLIAECTEEEIEILNEDKHFQLLLEMHEAIAEKDLLEKLDTAIDIAKDYGRSAGIQWKLERVNPGKWGRKEKKEDEWHGKLEVVLEGEDAETGG